VLEQNEFHAVGEKVKGVIDCIELKVSEARGLSTWSGGAGYIMRRESGRKYVEGESRPLSEYVIVGMTLERKHWPSHSGPS
jgi:hypothetical protein